MSLNYSFIETLKLLLMSLEYEIMLAITASMIVYVILLIINKDNKKTNYIFSIIIITIYYIKDIKDLNLPI